MSWDVDLNDADGNPVTVDSHTEGGTYVLGGTPTAELNVTYNYSRDFKAAFDGVGFDDMLNGKRAQDVTHALRRAVEKLGTERDDDYWRPTPGNAGYALSILLRWAEQHPDAVFKVM